MVAAGFFPLPVPIVYLLFDWNSAGILVGRCLETEELESNVTLGVERGGRVIYPLSPGTSSSSGTK